VVEATGFGVTIFQLGDEVLRPVIAATFPLADAAKAHERGDTRHVAGKLVLTMD
jgi:NADPH:quinone reductase-like Zn-dependent oxidoreductase